MLRTRTEANLVSWRLFSGGDNDEPQKEGILHLLQPDASKEQRRPRLSRNKGVRLLQLFIEMSYVPM